MVIEFWCVDSWDIIIHSSARNTFVFDDMTVEVFVWSARHDIDRALFKSGGCDAICIKLHAPLWHNVPETRFICELLSFVALHK